jgi:hypothetical protein
LHKATKRYERGREKASKYIKANASKREKIEDTVMANSLQNLYAYVGVMG